MVLGLLLWWKVVWRMGTQMGLGVWVWKNGFVRILMCLVIRFWISGVVIFLSCSRYNLFHHFFCCNVWFRLWCVSIYVLAESWVLIFVVGSFMIGLNHLWIMVSASVYLINFFICVWLKKNPFFLCVLIECCPSFFMFRNWAIYVSVVELAALGIKSKAAENWRVLIYWKVVIYYGSFVFSQQNVVIEWQLKLIFIFTSLVFIEKKKGTSFPLVISI